MTLDEKIILYKELQAKVKELETQKQKVYQEILGSFSNDQVQLETGQFLLKKFTRFTIKTSIEDARTLEATKTEETVDKDKIKQILYSGGSVPNVTESNYFFVHNQSLADASK